MVARLCDSQCFVTVAGLIASGDESEEWAEVSGFFKSVQVSDGEDEGE